MKYVSLRANKVDDQHIFMHLVSVDRVVKSSRCIDVFDLLNIALLV
jgi:hypothetical protein